MLDVDISRELRRQRKGSLALCALGLLSALTEFVVNLSIFEEVLQSGILQGAMSTMHRKLITWSFASGCLTLFLGWSFMLVTNAGGTLPRTLIGGLLVLFGLVAALIPKSFAWVGIAVCVYLIW